MIAMFDDERLLYPNPAKFRYHCTMCGLFVKFSSVRTRYSFGVWEKYWEGICSKHGTVEVTWGQQ